MNPRSTNWYSLLLGAIWVVHVHGAEPWTLRQAMDKALLDNPNSVLARHRIARAKAVLLQAKAASRPRFQIQSSYIRTDNPIGVFGAALNQQSFSPTLDFNNVPDADNLNLKGLITVPLYTGGRHAAGRAAATASTRASEEDAEAVRNTLAFEVARVFHTVSKTRAFIRAAEAAVRAFETNRSLASNRYHAGAALKIEPLDFGVRLAQAREDLVRTQNAHALALRAFRNLLGMEGGDIAVADEAPEAAVPASYDPSERPELRAARRRIQAAEADFRGARSGFLPQVDAFGSLDFDGGLEFDGTGESYTAGILFRWDLWDGKRTRGKVSEAAANLAIALETETKIRLAIDLEVEQARLNLNEANQRLAVTEKAIEEAAESALITRNRYGQGLALSTQLIDAETALTAARVRRAEAAADRRISIAALRKALGLPQLETAPARP